MKRKLHCCKNQRKLSRKATATASSEALVIRILPQVEPSRQTFTCLNSMLETLEKMFSSVSIGKLEQKVDPHCTAILTVRSEKCLNLFVLPHYL